jgi:hypothetical protein
MSSAKRAKRYPSKADVARAVQAVAATGIPVCSVMIRPDGTIALSSGQLPIAGFEGGDASEFETWDRAGRL